MRTLPAAITAHLNDDPTFVTQLVELQGTNTYYFTNHPVSLSWNGHTWQNAPPFVVSQIVLDAEGFAQATVTFDDQAQVIRGIRNTEGMANRKAIIREAWIDPTDGVTVLATQIVLSGRTDSIEGDEEGVNATQALTVTQSFIPLHSTGPSGRYQTSCTNRYKDTRCKYAGALTSCDRSYVDCVAHANTPNFRGFRFMVTGDPIQWAGRQIALDPRLVFQRRRT
jgi:hypothetical protein